MTLSGGTCATTCRLLSHKFIELTPLCVVVHLTLSIFSLLFTLTQNLNCFPILLFFSVIFEAGKKRDFVCDDKN